jgi:predicted SAM-dependent methyltransferase
MFTASKEIRRYLESIVEPKVNIGCGKNLIPGWAEVYRALRPGGYLRIVTPDLTSFAQFVLKQLPQHETIRLHFGA